VSIKPKGKVDRRKEFMDLFGLWTEDDLEELSRAVQDLEEIDREE
jgi:hypothetical protein